jgi:hypothetical protein
MLSKMSSAPGNVGFDPLWVSSMLPDEVISALSDALLQNAMVVRIDLFFSLALLQGWFKFLQEAEIKHSRVAMLAAAGAIGQDLFTLPGISAVIGDGEFVSEAEQQNFIYLLSSLS